MSEKKKGGLFGFFRKKEQTPEVEVSQEETTITEEEAVESKSESTQADSFEETLEQLDTELAENPEDDIADPEILEAIEQGTNVEVIDEANPQEESITSSEETELAAEIELAAEETATEEPLVEPVLDDESAAEEITEQTQEKPKKTGFFARLKSGLSKTRSQFTSGLADLVLGSKQIDEDLLEEIETQLLMADVGVEATRKIIDDLTDKAERKELRDPEALMERLRELLSEIVAPCSAPLEINKKPFVILMVGVNGVGKTTTIGKLAKKFQSEGKSVMLAAGDTFRAAAVEQLQVWGERNNIHVTAQHTGADSASVVFDALQAAQSRDIDVLIADTAGRLHTKSNLMDELEKVVRVMQKLDPEAPHETMLVVDAGTGQNALSQAEHFNKAVGLSGISISKLDGTAKGGVVFALADKLSIPIRFIGVGEGIDDLRPFDSQDFIEALFSKE